MDAPSKPPPTDRALWLAARDEIRAWERDWLARDPLTVVDRCDVVCKEGRARWPFLRLVGGVAARRHRERFLPLTLHAWLVAPTGAVLDPTVHQYEALPYAFTIGCHSRRQIVRYPFVLPAPWPERREAETCTRCGQPRVAGVCACDRTGAAYMRTLIGPVHPAIATG